MGLLLGRQVWLIVHGYVPSKNFKHLELTQFLGRPVMIREGDYDTPLPDVDPNEDRAPWQPLQGLKDTPLYHPVPGRVMSSFCAASRLCESLSFHKHDVC